VVVGEVVNDLESTDMQAIGDAVVLACLPPPIPPTQDIVERARELLEKYAAPAGAGVQRLAHRRDRPDPRSHRDHEEPP
jgi:hypothetical protein